jgi:hypothetical protein
VGGLPGEVLDRDGKPNGETLACPVVGNLAPKLTRHTSRSQHGPKALPLRRTRHLGTPYFLPNEMVGLPLALSGQYHATALV